MTELKPHVSLLIAANGFLAAPNSFRARLVADVRAFDGADIPQKQDPLWKQFRDACERAAAAPAANLAIATEGLGEILQLANKHHELERARTEVQQPVITAPVLEPFADFRGPIVCPSCGELSRSRAACDVCGEEIEATVGDAA